MKNITTLTILSALVLGLPLIQVSAEEAVTTDAAVTDTRPADRPTAKDRLDKMKDAREQHKENAEMRKDNMEEKRAEMQENRAEHKGEITDAVKAKIAQRINRAQERMSAMVNRFTKIIDRLDSRINTLTENGVDTTEAIRLVADARTALGDAQSTIDAINVDAILAAEDIRSALTEAKTSMKAAKESFRSAHTSLRDAVKSLRANVGTDSQEE